MAVIIDPLGSDVLDAALADVKDWLRMSTDHDDGALRQLAASAIGHAEQFCGLVLIQRQLVEILPATPDWQRLQSEPVRAWLGVRGLPADDAPFDMSAGQYEIRLDAREHLSVRILASGAAGRVEVRVLAGSSAAWADMPGPLRQGIVRLAAHLFQEREASAPPALVTALWRPWRRMRLT